MFKITNNTQIIKTKEFLKDELQFNLMTSVINDWSSDKDFKMFYEEEKCIIINVNKDNPIIIWNKNNFTDYENLYTFIKNEFKDNVPLKIISKSEMYHYLIEKNRADTSVSKELGAYFCNNLKEINYIGKADNIKENEVKLVANMLKNFAQETRGENLLLEDCFSDAQKFINKKSHKVWRSYENKIVSIAIIRETEKFSRLGHIYTLTDERGKSYAKMLAHYMSKQEIEKEKIPILYTYSDEIAPNKCYKAIGYELYGKIMYYKVR